MKKSFLTIRNLSAAVAGKDILKNVNLTIKSGEIHAVMGPNGSGKSTLAYALTGHPEYKYQIPNAKCQIRIGNKNIINLPTAERARAGLFLAMQSPIAVPGVSVTNILREAYQAVHGHSREISKTAHNPIFSSRWQGNGLSLPQFMSRLRKEADLLGVNETLLTRGVNDGFSGGEKKKLEMLQAIMLHPKFAIFDEIDTGLDVDALKIVAKAIRGLTHLGTGVIIITHYQRILKFLKPDKVHILVNGTIVRSGEALLATKIENEGYGSFAVN